MGQPPLGTVFVIDDDEAVRDSLKLLLESHLLPVHDFASVPEFLQAVGPRPRGCLVLDLHLPVIGGLDFLGRYRDRLNGMPVILITGKADAATRARAFEAGVRHFLEKPFEDHEVVGAVADALALNAAVSETAPL
ncbi:MAG: transcriptional regulatory protein [Rhodospirillales bacterium]|jgi:FixJ family two-component response regulator|nr:transcriptional regulatory protein [Rhodospirillales bacterium]